MWYMHGTLWVWDTLDLGRSRSGTLWVQAALGLGCSRFGLLWIWATAAFRTGRGCVRAGLQTMLLPWSDGSWCRERGRLRLSALLGRKLWGFCAWK